MQFKLLEKLSPSLTPMGFLDIEIEIVKFLARVTKGTSLYDASLC